MRIGPRAQLGEACKRQRGQPVEAARVKQAPDQAQCIFSAGNDRGGRHVLASQLAVVDFAIGQGVAAPAMQLPGPVLHRAELCAHVGDSRCAQRDGKREQRLILQARRQDAALVPQALDGSPNVGRCRPAARHGWRASRSAWYWPMVR
jgi:hypothetical protein